MALKLRLAKPAARHRLTSLSTSAEASYHVAGGKLVGIITKHQRGGTQLAASYRLGSGD